MVSRRPLYGLGLKIAQFVSGHRSINFKKCKPKSRWPLWSLPLSANDFLTAMPNAKLSGGNPSPAMLEVENRDSVNPKQGDAENLPFPGQEFDIVVYTNAFHYFRNSLDALEDMAFVTPGWMPREHGIV